ncbi:hypothetical protein BJX70DRAFT_398787 [Aspergillus crustosus]
MPSSSIFDISLTNWGPLATTSFTPPAACAIVSTVVLYATDTPEIHLLQRVLLGQQASMLETVPQTDKFINALRRWTSIWQLAPKLSLDPLNLNGPHPIYLHGDPQTIAGALLNSTLLVRSPSLVPALLHATHALSIPVKLGVDYVSRSQAFVWSIQHALCGLEFAVFLTKWLKAVGQSKTQQPLEAHEKRLLNWIYRVVAEGRSSLEGQDIVAGELDL